jgi:hypothetical protein
VIDRVAAETMSDPLICIGAQRLKDGLHRAG